MPDVSYAPKGPDTAPSPPSKEVLRSVRREAVPWAMMSGLTESFMIPYALALGASAFQAGLLSSFRNFVLSLVQLESADLTTRFRSRKTLVLWSAWVQAVLWVPLAVVGLLFGPWAVPADQRWMTVSGLFAGGVCIFFAARPLVGFGLLCLGAFLTRAWSCRLLRQLSEGPLEEPKEARFSFWQFIRQFRTSNFVQFSLCIGLFSFAVNLASPFLSVYMLQDLQYGYFIYTAIVLTGSVAGFFP